MQDTSVPSLSATYTNSNLANGETIDCQLATSLTCVTAATADAPQMDFVFTVCDNVAGEVCPVWPGQPMTAHWGVPDPSAAQGDDEQRAKAFWNVATMLKRRIDLMLALPLASLDRLASQREVREIGTR